MFKLVSHTSHIEINQDSQNGIKPDFVCSAIIFAHYIHHSFAAAHTPTHARPHTHQPLNKQKITPEDLEC